MARLQTLGHGRDIYLLHKHWRYVLEVTTAYMGLQQTLIHRPIFRSIYLAFGSGNPWVLSAPGVGISIHDVWSFFSLLFDLVLESISGKIISGETTTENAAQHAEQILLRLGSGHQGGTAAPLVNFYQRICFSDIFNVLVGRREKAPTTTWCTFLSLAEIVEDAGGRYVYLMVKNFVSAKLRTEDVIGHLSWEGTVTDRMRPRCNIPECRAGIAHHNRELRPLWPPFSSGVYKGFNALVRAAKSGI